MYAPSGVGSRVGGALRSSGVVMVSEERKEFAISMPCVSALSRYPCVMLWLCAVMEGKGRDVEECTRIVVRHHGAQCAPPPRGQSGGGMGG